MDSPKERKKGRRPGRLFWRWHWVFEGLDRESVALSVNKLVQDHPAEDEKALVRRVVRRSARRSAAVGVVSAAPALLPGLGLAVAFVGLLPEEIYLARRACEMILQIAAIYGLDPTRDERLVEIAELVGARSRLTVALMTAKEDLGRIAAKAAASLGPRVGQRTLFGMRAFSRGVVRRLPAIGVLAGGAINYFSLRAIGRRASRYYERLIHSS